MRSRSSALLLAPLLACAGAGNRPRPVEAPPQVAQAPTRAASDSGAAAAQAQVAPPAASVETTLETAAASEAARVPAESRVPAVTRVPAVARVGGTEIGVDELVEAWTRRESAVVRRYLDELVLERLVVAEATRLDLTLEAAEAEAAAREVRARIEEQVRRAGSTDLRAFLRQELGLDPDRYLEAAERSAVVQLLAERCVRAFTLAQERREVAVILCADREVADLVQAGLARGEDFADLARAHSTDASGAEGGRIPAVLRTTSAISRLAFHTEVGEIGGPLEQGERWVFVRVEGAPLPQAGPWPAVGRMVLDSLAADPISDPEYWQWKDAMVDRYEVDTGPLLELIGEPGGGGAEATSR